MQNFTINCKENYRIYVYKISKIFFGYGDQKAWLKKIKFILAFLPFKIIETLFLSFILGLAIQITANLKFIRNFLDQRLLNIINDSKYHLVTTILGIAIFLVVLLTYSITRNIYPRLKQSDELAKAVSAKVAEATRAINKINEEQQKTKDKIVLEIQETVQKVQEAAQKVQEAIVRAEATNNEDAILKYTIESPIVLIILFPAAVLHNVYSTTVKWTKEQFHRDTIHKC